MKNVIFDALIWPIGTLLVCMYSCVYSRLWGLIIGPSVLFGPLFGDSPLDFEVRDLFDWTDGQQNLLSITAQLAGNNSSGD